VNVHAVDSFWWILFGFFGLLVLFCASFVVIACQIALVMAAPLFGDDWLEKDAVDYAEAYSQFQGAVSTARTSTDEGIKQVAYIFLLFFPFFSVFWFFA